MQPARHARVRASRSFRAIRGMASDQTSRNHVEPPPKPRWFWPALVGLVAVTVIGRFLLLTEYLRHNPLATHLLQDAATYWSWAEKIAGGELVDDRPFFSAPLYPYLLGLLRAGGGGLTSVYVLQITLDLVTAVLLACVTRVRFGAGVGLLTAALFLLLVEPASFSLRVLTSTLQLPLVVLAWRAMIRGQQRPTATRAACAGGTLGLLALTYPPALVGLPALGLWWWWMAQPAGPSQPQHTSPRPSTPRRPAAQAVLAVLSGLLVISPVTLHNYIAGREFTAISAQGGVTFAAGNAPGADGTYFRLPGVSRDRATQNEDARRVCQEATGGPASWRAVNRYFYRQGLSFWREHPAAAAALIARKAYWFLTGRLYDDIYVPEIERSDGLLPRLWLTPLPTAWLIPPALLAAAAWLRRPRVWWPELLLLAIPLLVVLVFWYSARYRLPAVPPLAAAAAVTLIGAAGRHAPRSRRLAAVVAVVLGPTLSLVNRALGFDAPEPRRAQLAFSLGWAATQTGRYEEAESWFRQCLRLTPHFPSAAANLGAVLLARGEVEAAAPVLEQAAQADPHDAFVLNQLGRVYAVRNQPDEALRNFEAAARLRPDSAEMQFDVGVTLARAGQTDAALERFRAAIALDPRLTRAHVYVAHLWLARGDLTAGVAALRAANALEPENQPVALDLAWFLATMPTASPEDRATALRLARAAADRTADPRPLDVLAAALAANGLFDEAAGTIARAVHLADHGGRTELAEALRRRLELYRAGRPYTLPHTP